MQPASRQEEQRQRIAMLDLLVMRQGKSISEAARLIGMDESTAHHLARRHSIKRPQAEDEPIAMPEDNSLMGAVWHALSGRLKEHGDHYRLDGLPTSFGDVVKEANRVRVQLGQRQVGKNPAWKVPA